jgi:hypothetical protein
MHYSLIGKMGLPFIDSDLLYRGVSKIFMGVLKYMVYVG